MTVAELMEQYAAEDVDVYDNYTEELGIAYCGTQLTDEGKEHFKEALALPIEGVYPNQYGKNVIIAVDEDGCTDKDCEHRLRIAKELFESMAGYCADEDWQKWFKDE